MEREQLKSTLYEQRLFDGFLYRFGFVVLQLLKSQRQNLHLQ